MLRPYNASGKMESGALPLFALACFGGAVASGLVFGLIAHFFIDLLIVFPALTGALGVLLGGLVLEKKKIRAPRVVGLIALCAGLLAQGVVHVVDYAATRASVVDEETSSADFDAWLLEHTGHDGLVGFQLDKAQEGVSIRSNHGSSSDHLTGVGAWSLWGLELLIAGVVAFAIAFGRAKKPFCERCNAWYAPPAFLAFGDGSKATFKAVKAALAEGRCGEIRALLGTPIKTFCELKIARCSTCQDSDVALSVFFKGGTPSNQKRAQGHKNLGMMSAAESRQLEASLEATPTANVF